MPRKSDGTTTSRKKKGTLPAETAAVQPAPAQAAEVRSEAVRNPEVRATEVRTNEVRAGEVRANVTPINVSPIKPTAKKPVASPANLDEEIRRRAYELFLERKGAAGDPMADWVIAEREVRARYAGKESAFAAGQGS